MPELLVHALSEHVLMPGLLRVGARIGDELDGRVVLNPVAPDAAGPRPLPQRLILAAHKDTAVVGVAREGRRTAHETRRRCAERDPPAPRPGSPRFDPHLAVRAADEHVLVIGVERAGCRRGRQHAAVSVHVPGMPLAGVVREHPERVVVAADVDVADAGAAGNRGRPVGEAHRRRSERDPATPSARRRPPLLPDLAVEPADEDMFVIGRHRVGGRFGRQSPAILVPRPPVPLPAAKRRVPQRVVPAADVDGGKAWRSRHDRRRAGESGRGLVERQPCAPRRFWRLGVMDDGVAARTQRDDDEAGVGRHRLHVLVEDRPLAAGPPHPERLLLVDPGHAGWIPVRSDEHHRVGAETALAGHLVPRVSGGAKVGNGQRIERPRPEIGELCFAARRDLAVAGPRHVAVVAGGTRDDVEGLARIQLQGAGRHRIGAAIGQGRLYRLPPPCAAPRGWRRSSIRSTPDTTRRGPRGSGASAPPRRRWRRRRPSRTDVP